MIIVFKRSFHFFIVQYSIFFTVSILGSKAVFIVQIFSTKKVQKQTFTLMAVKLRVLSLQLVFLSINKKLRVSRMYQKTCNF